MNQSAKGRRNGRRGSGQPARRTVSQLALAAALCVLAAPPTAQAETTGEARSEIVERFQVVDCLLPGKVRQLGRSMRFLDRRRPARLPAGECETRGGEYTVHDRSNPKASFDIWMPLALDGDETAQLIVGELSERGAGGAPDYQMAHLWYERAAEQGNAAAMFNLSRLHEQGLGVPKDDEAAAGWLRRAYGLDADPLEDVVRIERMETEIATLSETVETLRSDLEQAEAEKRELERQLREMEAALETASADIAELTSALADARRKTAQAAAAYEQQLGTLQARLSEASQQETVIIDREGMLVEKLDALAQRQVDATERLFSRLADLPSLASQSARLASLQAQVTAAREDARRLQAEKQAALAAKQAAAEEAASARAALERELETLASREAQLAEREADLATQMSRAEAATAEAADPALSQAQAEAIATQAAEIAAEQARLEQQRKAVEAHLSALERGRRTQQAREAALANAQAELEAQRDELNAREAALQQARLEVAEQARAVQVNDRTQQETLDQLDEEFARLAEERRQLETERGQLKALRSELADTSVEIALTEQQLAEQTREIEERAADLSERERAAEVREAELEALRAEAESARRKLAALEGILTGQTRSMGLAPASEGLKPVAERQDLDIDFGTYHAILIGNANYVDTNWHDLDTPHNDVRRIGEILETRYGFRTDILIDATQDEILAAIETAQQTLGDKDNLLIYFAGHGKYSDDAKVGFWEPVDSITTGFRKSISAQEVNMYLSAMRARKVLVISDSCYSGVFAREMTAQLDPNANPGELERFYMIQAAKRSRVAMTAGGMKPVVDGIGNGHSLFASAFINALMENDDVALARNLFTSIRRNVVSGAAQFNLDQEPSFADLVHTGHEGGDFIFVPRV